MRRRRHRGRGVSGGFERHRGRVARGASDTRAGKWEQKPAEGATRAAVAARHGGGSSAAAGREQRRLQGTGRARERQRYQAVTGRATVKTIG